jgi:hypothetical protein
MRPCARWQRCTTTSTDEMEFQEKPHGEERCWPHLWVRCLYRGGPGGHCRFPADRVAPCMNFKTRQGARCAPTRCHVSHSSRPCLPAQAGSNAAACPMAPDPASLLRRAPTLPCVPQLRTSSRLWGGLQHCHVSPGSEPHLFAQEAPMLPHILWPAMGHGLKE